MYIQAHEEDPGPGAGVHRHERIRAVHVYNRHRGPRGPAFYPGDPVELIRKLKNVDSYLARVTPRRGDPMLAVFDVRGLEEIVSRYASDVQW